MLTIATCFPPVDESSAFVVKTVGEDLNVFLIEFISI